MIIEKLQGKKNPQATVLGGLAGSGKSNYIATLNNTYAVIGDDYRNMHPRFKEIVKEYGDNWVFSTNDFAVAMIEKVTVQVIKDRKNVVIEGTFRTFTAPANTLKQFKAAGYETHAHVVLCHKDIARAGTVERYYKMLQSGLPGRMVTAEKFQEMLAGLADTADKIKKSQLVKTFTMTARRDLGNLVTVYQVNNENLPGTVIRQEMNRELTLKEKEFIRQIKEYKEQELLIKIRKTRDEQQKKVTEKSIEPQLG